MVGTMIKKKELEEKIKQQLNVNEYKFFYNEGMHQGYMEGIITMLVVDAIVLLIILISMVV